MARKLYKGWDEAAVQALQARAQGPIRKVKQDQPAIPTGPALPEDDGEPLIKFRSKTEEQYAAMLEAERLAGSITSWAYEPMKLRLGDGQTITLDFMVYEPTRWYLVEVKGAWSREDGVAKLKACAALYPRFEIYLARKTKNAGWVTRRVAP